MATKEKKDMTTIGVQKSTAKRLQGLWREWDDTYDSVILRLINGSKGNPHEDRGDGDNESTGVGHKQTE